jgi:hypothetical protein
MTYKIDPALVRLSYLEPGRVFPCGGYAVQWTSTCDDAPACWPVSEGQVRTAKMYTGIAVDFTRMRDSTYSRSEKIEICSELWGRSPRTVETALKVRPAILKST